jgi:hypothetical protein
VHSLRRLQALNPVIGLAAVSDLAVGYFMIGIRAVWKASLSLSRNEEGQFQNYCKRIFQI